MSGKLCESGGKKKHASQSELFFLSELNLK